MVWLFVTNRHLAILKGWKNHFAHNFDICYKHLKYLAIVGACSQNDATYARCWTPVTCLRCEQLDLDSVHFLTIRPMNLFWESSAPKFAKWVPYGPWNVSDLISDLMLWCCSDTPLVLLLLRISADFCASLLFHLKLHQNISSVIFNWTSLKIWAFVVFYEAKRCSSYLLWPHWQCELLWFPLKQSAAAAALGAAAAGRAFLSWKGGSRQVSSNQVAKSPPSHRRGVQPCAPPQFWKQVLTQEFFPHSWKRNCVLSVSGHTSSITDNSSCLSSSPHLFLNCFLTFAAA